jgi:hypothetical protein
VTLLVHLANYGVTRLEKGLEKVFAVFVVDATPIVDHSDEKHHFARVRDRFLHHDDSYLLIVLAGLERVLDQVNQDLSGSHHVNHQLHIWNFTLKLQLNFLSDCLLPKQLYRQADRLI